MKDIKGYEGLYAATEEGKIWAYRKKTSDGRTVKERFLKTWLIGHGYETVMLYKDGVSAKFLVHRLVAQTFIPNPDNLREVNHLDANKLNNRADNLEWVSSKENKRHAIALGLYENLGRNTPKGSKHPSSKLTETQVREIKKRISNGEFKRALGREYGVSDTLIRYICRGSTWKHI